ncbi:MAG: hypothetical protein IT462_04160 [Planctomycetes bacterium]|nr:hypothetical protein [Planctomycetota bacterium]
MSVVTLIWLILPATLLNGLLTGANGDRYVVQVPAWRHFDLQLWAEHSRHADLGNGRFWYPVLAIGAAALSLVVAVAATLNAAWAASLGPPAQAAAIFSVGGLVVTGFAAPRLLRLRKPADSSTVAKIFGEFHERGRVRALLQAAAFAANLWSLVIAARL